MKIALTADWQFAPHYKLSKPTPGGLPSRFVDQLVCFRWVTQTARDLGCERLVLAGDVFDNRTAIDIPVLDQVRDAVDYAAQKLEVDIIPGNHDSYARSSTFTSVRALRSARVHVHVTPQEVVFDGRRFVFLPWVDDPNEVAAMVDKVQPKKVVGSVLIAHALISGVVTAGNKGTPLKALRPDRFDCVWLGDVHEPTLVKPGVQYIGSPMQIDYRDAGGMRGFYVFDTNKMTAKYVENDVSPRFHVVKEATPGSRRSIRKADFVRVKIADAGAAKEWVDALGGAADHVECASVDVGDEPPRMSVKTGDDDAVLLRRYVNMQGVDTDAEDALVKLGVAMLSEVTS